MAFQPILQPFPDWQSELRFASRMMRNPFGLAGSLLMRDQLSYVANAYLESLCNFFLGLFAFFATLQNPASQVVSVGFRHSLCRRRSFAELTLAQLSSVHYLLKRYRVFGGLTTQVSGYEFTHAVSA